jgi:HSP20 family protein
MFDLMPWKRRNSGQAGGLGEQTTAHPLARFRDEFDSLMERFWSDWQPSLAEWGDDFFGPRWGLDLREEENEYVLRAEAPGFEPGEFDVQISGGQLILRAEHKEEQQEGQQRGFRYGRLYRTITLPAGVEQDKIDATYRNGVLELRLPKGEQAKGRRVEVKA